MGIVALEGQREVKVKIVMFLRGLIYEKISKKKEIASSIGNVIISILLHLLVFEQIT